MKRAFAWLLTSVLFFAACAIIEPPPGGPEDRAAPKIDATAPRPDSSGVSPQSDIRITFNESMSKARFERLIRIHPQVAFSKIKWDKNTVVLTPDGPLHPDTTYIVEIQPGFGDARGVRNNVGYRFAFATSARIDSGAISGTVFFRRKPSEKAGVRLFVLPTDSGFAVEEAKPDREVFTNKDGSYSLGYLPTGNRSFLVWAYQDENGNKLFDHDREAVGPAPDTLLLTRAVSRIESNDIRIVDLKEPGEISGVVDNQTGIDSAFISVTITAANDTLPPTHVTVCDAEGNYSFRSALMGSYVLHAFIDFKRDSLCGDYPCQADSSLNCSEPCVQYADTIVVEPGSKIKIDRLVLPAVDSNGNEQ